MKKIARIVSWLSLLAVIAPAFLYLNGSITLAGVHTLMLVFSVLWFATVPLWMGRKH